MDGYDMMRSEIIHYGMFFVGVMLVVSSVGVGIGALHYKFQYESVTEDPENWERPLYEYQNLTEEEQKTVEQAINGTTFVFESSRPIPGRATSSLGGQEFMILYPNGDKYYIFSHEIIFVPTHPAGYTAIALLLTGSALVTDAIRRHHFPHRTAFWQ